MRSLDEKVIIANMTFYCMGIILSCGTHVVFLKYTRRVRKVKIHHV